MRVVWTTAALNEISRVYTYVAQFNPAAAAGLAEALLAAGDSLVSFPHRGRPLPGTNLREWALVYPYIIRYRLAEDRVVILRVRHGKRRT